jgi:SAM-dependent methyltransferase
MMEQTHCPLCHGRDVAPYHEDARRPYLQCGNCRLVFVPPAWRLDREAERAEYDLHRNEVDDPGYRRFLSRVFDPLRERLSPGARGLDFGCGPGPALAQMLREAGFEVVLYDSFYWPAAEALERSYGFICATEVVEHLHWPGPELERLWSCLEPGGWLAVMTKLVRDVEAFSRWHYKNDATHVCFFSDASWRWWAAEHETVAEFIGADVILLQKRA